MDEVATLIDELSLIPGDTDEEGATISQAVKMLQTQQDLLQVMGEFLGQYREEFEENLSYEQQEQYREHFGLEHATLGESGALGDDDNDD